MSMQSEGKDAKGRNFDQTTKGGSGSAASMGTGGTGAVQPPAGQQGSEQRASRTDDLLAGASADQEAEQGFGGSAGGELKTGMEGIGKGADSKGGGGAARQSAEPQQDNPARKP